MTNPYSEMYRRKVLKLEEQIENIRTFPCKISGLVDTAIKIEDALKKTDDAYTALPSQIKIVEKDMHQKSIDLIKKYRTIMTDMDNMCDCRQRQLQQQPSQHISTQQ